MSLPGSTIPGGGALWGGGTGATGTPTTGGTSLVSDLLYHAMRLAGITLGPSRTPSIEQYADGLLAFNRFTGSLNTLADAIFTRNILTFDTVGQQQSYLWGPGGEWDAPRPQRLEHANLFLSRNPDLRRPLALWNDEEWGAIRLQEIYTYPLGVYIDGDAPLSRVYCYPIPDRAYTMEFYTWEALPKAASKEDLLGYPDGYEQMLVYNVAVNMMPMFRKRLNSGLEDQMVIDQARQSLARIKGLNSLAPRLTSDAPQTGPRTTPYFNYRTGDIR